MSSNDSLVSPLVDKVFTRATAGECLSSLLDIKTTSDTLCNAVESLTESNKEKDRQFDQGSK